MSKVLSSWVPLHESAIIFFKDKEALVFHQWWKNWDKMVIQAWQKKSLRKHKSLLRHVLFLLDHDSEWQKINLVVFNFLPLVNLIISFSHSCQASLISFLSRKVQFLSFTEATKNSVFLILKTRTVKKINTFERILYSYTNIKT